MPASSYQQQKLRVCEVCSAYLGIHDNDRRLADHFGGKLHLGFIQIREKLEGLLVRISLFSFTNVHSFSCFLQPNFEERRNQRREARLNNKDFGNEDTKGRSVSGHSLYGRSSDRYRESERFKDDRRRR